LSTTAKAGLDGFEASAAGVSLAGCAAVAAGVVVDRDVVTVVAEAVGAVKAVVVDAENYLLGMVTVFDLLKGAR
jgi:hypothetical protein